MTAVASPGAVTVTAVELEAQLMQFTHKLNQLDVEAQIFVSAVGTTTTTSSSSSPNNKALAAETRLVLLQYLVELRRTLNLLLKKQLRRRGRRGGRGGNRAKNTEQRRGSLTNLSCHSFE
eukprot:TRINITY_DN7321_c0_g1_i1.p1 TRINITY_DN7321_c0_g1~~TRINITY_DN7321_c0_g1_i1.p1  ORF type:complete len:138 (+),score=32.11 TRINITY_DN7321_c0_g1_i1:55-414(+)